MQKETGHNFPHWIYNINAAINKGKQYYAIKLLVSKTLAVNNWR